MKKSLQFYALLCAMIFGGNLFGQTSVDCGGSGLNETYCYGNSDNTTFWYQSSDNSSGLSLIFSAGDIEDGWDELIIYDGSDDTAPVLFSGDNGGDLTGVSVVSTGADLFMAVDSDGSNSCQEGQQGTVWDWNLSCLSCAVGAGSASVGSCDPANGFMIDVDVTDLGDGSIVIKNDGGVADVTVTSTGVTMVGPFAFSSSVTITLGHPTDATCDVVLPVVNLPSGCPPSNDECDGAIVLVHEDNGSCTNTASTLVNSTQSQAACAGSGDNDVWFIFEATATSAIIDVTGGPDIVTQVFEEGGGCSALGASLVCSDPNDPTVTGLTVGATYYIRINVWNTSTTPSTFDICVTTPPEPPSNNECSTATTINQSDDETCTNAVSGTTNVANNSAGTCSTTGREVWYAFTPAASGNYNTLVTETFDSGFTSTYVSVWDGTCGNLTQIGSTSCFVTSILDFALVGGTTYYIVVRSSSNTTYTEFDLCVYPSPPPPINDECANATMLDCGVTLTDQTTVSSVSPDDPIGCASDFGVWYTFMGAGVEVTVSSTAASGYDHELDIFSTDGGCAGAFTQVVCDDGAGSGGTETHTFTPDAGVQYFVYVAHFSTTSSVTGEFDISLDCACDNPVATVSLEGTCPTYSIDVDLASLGGATSVDITNDVNGSEHIGVSTLQIYNLGGFTAGDGTVTITVADANDPTCDIEYTVDVPIACPPVNDDVANAIDISIDAPCTGDAYTNVFSSEEAGEVDGSCFALTTTVNSVWFTFTAPVSGSVNITNDILGDGTGDLTDGQLAVFSVTDPTDFSTFTQVACSEDDGSVVGFGYMNDIDVTGLTAGDTYYVLVDGYGSAVGDFCLEISTLCEAATRVALPTATTTALPADACTDGVDGFTYYDDGAGNYIFAIAWDPNGTGANAAAKAAAEVEIRKYTANGTQAGVWEPFDNSATEASFALLTSWNVDLNGSSMTGPVDVKFYYDAAEKADVDAASAAHASANGVTDNGGMWYKNETSDYIHAGQVSAADFSDNMTILTDVAGGATDNGVPYARFDGVTSFSGGAYATGAGAGFLPIEIARFDAKAMNLGNKVMWATASEVQNDYQMIQKSQDGMGGWSEVGRVKSDGDSKELRSYEVMDMDPYATTYYRVYSVDLDGRVQISTVISVERSVSNSMTIYPNPARDRATVVVESANDGSATVSVIDITGKLVSTITLNVVAGQSEVPLDLSNLQQGVYSVIYSSAEASSVQRLVVE